MGLIWFARSAAQGGYFVPGGDEPRDEEGADVASGANDDDSNGRIGLERWLLLWERNLFGLWSTASSRVHCRVLFALEDALPE